MQGMAKGARLLPATAEIRVTNPDKLFALMALV
jgi:hypothetical protein